ncbi:MAG: FAD-dependent oxidoreductase [Deltaproteobacteria bacterium]|jgi:glycerol-3-phosphate dehydrogenase|nr:FAD-dependent oxidoreductase [Deltaproteobacteria bacterium]
MGKPKIAIIGGGSTGTAIFRDLALRGFPATLLEARQPASGATGGCQGLLHSGCRYAVTEPSSAKECAAENAIMRRIAPHLLESDLVAVYAALPQDGTEYLKTLSAACGRLGIKVERLSGAEALKLAPALNPEAEGGLRTLDAPLDPFRLCLESAAEAVARGGRMLSWSPVVNLLVKGGRAAGLTYLDLENKRERLLETDLIINAAGSFAAEVASMGGLKLPIAFSKGTDLVFASRISEAFLARCRRPSDGDVIVPHGSASLWGTTSVRVDHPGYTLVERGEVESLLKDLSELIPGGEKARLLRAYAGVRPLAVSASGEIDDRGLTRDFAIHDHQAESGLEGLISVVGGKMCTCRLMAERTTDLALRKLKTPAKCLTAQIRLPGAEKGAFFSRLPRLAKLTGGEKALGGKTPWAKLDALQAETAAILAEKDRIQEAKDREREEFIDNIIKLKKFLAENSSASLHNGILSNFDKIIPEAEYLLPIEDENLAEKYGLLSQNLKKISPILDGDHLADPSLICRCEAVAASETAKAALEAQDGDLGSLRIRTRLGMGPCQGAGCAYKALGQLAHLFLIAPKEAPSILADFLDRRFRGARPVLRGEQLAQQMLAMEVYEGMLSLEAPKPRPDPLAPPGRNGK